MSRIHICLIILLIFLPLSLYSQNSIEDYINRANTLYIRGEYEGAFTQINHYLFVAEKEEVTGKANILGEKIYYFYIRSLFNAKDFIGITFIEKSLDLNPQLKSDRVVRALLLLKDGENTDLINPIFVDKVDNTQLDDDNDINKTEYNNEELTLLLKKSLLEGQDNSKKANTVTLLLILLVVFIFISMVSITVFIFVTLTNRKKNIIQTGNTLSPVFIGYNVNPVEEFDKLLNHCKKIGKDIDEATGRKNNSENTAELVYKISKLLEYSEKDALLFYSAALIYDIGLLGIDSGILKSESVSHEQFEQIKKHVINCDKLLVFIPKEYNRLFTEAVSMHHENLDGSGYPKGLVGDEIPYLPRVLRVVESYISQISSRKYRVINDKETAIKHLYEEADVYDQSIVNCLYQVI